MFDFGSEGMIGRVLGNVSSILVIDDPQAVLRARVVVCDFRLRPAASEASVTLAKSLRRKVFGSYLGHFFGRVEILRQIASVRGFKEVVTPQGRQVVAGRLVLGF